jgi:hypothetical protein
LTMPRFLIVVFLLIGIWLLLAWLAVSPKGAKTHSNAIASLALERSADDPLQRTVEWLQSSGINYLGCVQWSNAASPTKRVRLPLPTKSDETTVKNESQLHLPFLLKRLGEVGLSGWVLALVLRMSVDTAWRELVFTAPLAGLSRLVSGI